MINILRLHSYPFNPKQVFVTFGMLFLTRIIKFLCILNSLITYVFVQVISVRPSQNKTKLCSRNWLLYHITHPSARLRKKLNKLPPRIRTQSEEAETSFGLEPLFYLCNDTLFDPKYQLLVTDGSKVFYFFLISWNNLVWRQGA